MQTVQDILQDLANRLEAAHTELEFAECAVDTLAETDMYADLVAKVNNALADCRLDLLTELAETCQEMVDDMEEDEE